MNATHPGIERSRWSAIAPEGALVLALFFFYLWCFDLLSAVHGPYEVFAQDSVYILHNLEAGHAFPWNPQSHLLYHFVVERGHDAWHALFDPSPLSTYRYLKLFTALCGLAFLVGMRRLFVELRLTRAQRLPLLLLTGLSVSAWFHFAAFETHCLALPAVALYLVAVARLTMQPVRRPIDRVLLVGSLLVCGWTRVDLFRLTVATCVLLLEPSMRRHLRSLALDLVLVATLGFAGNAVLASAYLERPLADVLTTSLDRDDRPQLEHQLGSSANLSPGSLVVVGRAISLYSILMPVERRPEGRSFLAPPSYELRLVYDGGGVFPSTDLFLKPAGNLLGSGLGMLAFLGISAVLACSVSFGVVRALSGYPFQALLLAQAVTGWLFYTWFNPYEPFLWIVEFLPLWLALIAELVRLRTGTVYAAALWLVALVVAVHNWFAFYVPFR